MREEACPHTSSRLKLVQASFLGDCMHTIYVSCGNQAPGNFRTILFGLAKLNNLTHYIYKQLDQFMKSVCLICCLLIPAGLFAQDQGQVQLVDSSLLGFPAMRDYCIGASGEEDFFTIQSLYGEISQIATRTKVNGVWSAPKLLSFCDQFTYLEPFLSSDGLRLYFVSDRPLTDTGTVRKDFDIWYVTRARPGGPWMKPTRLAAPVNSDKDEFYPCITASQDLYFTMDAPDGAGKDDIYVSVWNGQSYEAPVLCGDAINSAGYEFNAWVAPDGNTMIYTRYGTADGYGSGDLYLAKKDASGNWQQATNLGAEINSGFMEYCPFYDQQTQTLYFTSKRSDLSGQDFSTLSELEAMITGGFDGLSRLYRITLRL